MPDLTAKRTLVKSAPELWGELSEVERLAKHLGAFGEIEITKLEPEHTVAWEGEHASGTVSIEPSGWGTKVTLTAELAELQPDPVEHPALHRQEQYKAGRRTKWWSRSRRSRRNRGAGRRGAIPRPGFWSRLFRRRPRDEAAIEAEQAPEPLVAVASRSRSRSPSRSPPPPSPPTRRARCSTRPSRLWAPLITAPSRAADSAATRRELLKAGAAAALAASLPSPRAAPPPPPGPISS